jgi:hypothetical protein
MRETGMTIGLILDIIARTLGKTGTLTRTLNKKLSVIKLLLSSQVINHF